MENSLIAYTIIRDNIFSMKYKPGSRLKEVPLAEELNVSRDQIRRAISQLENEQLVETKRYKGACVAVLLQKDVEELFEIREMLEIKAIELAIRRSSRDDLDEIRNKLNKREKILFENEQLKYYIPKIDFHQEIMRLSKNDTLISIWNGISTRIKLIRIQSAMNRERFVDSLEEHKDILSNIYLNQPKKAENLLKLHIEKSKLFALSCIDSPEN